MLLQHALNYLRMGLSVIPLQPEKKEPLIPWQEYQKRYATTAEVTGWWTKTPDANIGICTGMLSKLAVVDLDGPDGITSGQSLKLSSPVTVLTGNGRQLYYRHPGTKVCNLVKTQPGVDVRGDGGYVVAPPSIHPNGKRYVWLNHPVGGFRLPTFPQILCSPVISGGRPVRNADGWIAESLEKMADGNIDITLFKICCRLRHDGYSQVDAKALLKPWADRAGATDTHLDDKIKNVWGRYMPEVQQAADHYSSIDTFLEDIKKVDWICEPMIARKTIGFVAGLPETMKTWLMIDLAVECARGNGLWVGLFPTSEAKVLFIDQERFRGETQRRFKSVIASKGLVSTDLRGRLFLKCGTSIKLDQDGSFQSFRNELLELQPDVVIVDSFATFHSSEENDRMSMQSVLEKIKSLRQEIGCTFIFIDHENKSVFSDTQAGVPVSGLRMVGSVGKIAAAEFMLTVRRLDPSTCLVHHSKSTMASATKSFYVSLKDTPEGVVVAGLNG